MDFSSLNEAQRRAVTFNGKHLLVLAGAGTGKTLVIVARAIWLMQQGIDPKTIRILSYTNKSAGEIVDRIHSEAASLPQAGDLHGSTFHSWCMELIGRYPDEFGLQGFVPVDEAISDSIRLNHDDYEAYKKDHRYLDFDDMLKVVAETMEKSGSLRLKVAADYSNILIDDVQDTDPLQWRLLECVSDICHLFCAGDDAQSIYAFRGADFRSIHRFASLVPGVEVLQLKDNYRSTREILDLCNWLLSQSPLDYDKDLHAVRGNGSIPQLHFCKGRPNEAQTLLSIIRSGLQAGKKCSDYLIISRTSRRVEELVLALTDGGIRVTQLGGKKHSIEQPYVRDVIAALRIIINHRDEYSWRRFLRLWTFEGLFDAPAFIESSMKCNSLDGMLAGLPRTDTISEKIYNCLIAARACWNEPAAAFGIVLSYLTPILSRKYADWQACKEDLETVRLLAVTCCDIPSFVGEYSADPSAALTRHGIKAGNEDSVVISTVHSAKGLENDTVIVLLREFPSFWCRTDADFEEERRCLYVALTRARNSLILTTKSHNGNNEDAGPFLSGLPDGLLATFPKPGIQRPITVSVEL